VCVTANEPDTKSYSNLNPTIKQLAIVSVQLSIFTCPTYPAEVMRDNVVALFLLLSVVIVTLSRYTDGSE